MSLSTIPAWGSSSCSVWQDPCPSSRLGVFPAPHLGFRYPGKLRGSVCTGSWTEASLWHCWGVAPASLAAGEVQEQVEAGLSCVQLRCGASGLHVGKGWVLSDEGTIQGCSWMHERDPVGAHKSTPPDFPLTHHPLRVSCPHSDHSLLLSAQVTEPQSHNH